MLWPLLHPINAIKVGTSVCRMGSCKLGVYFSLYGCHCNSELNVHTEQTDGVPEVVLSHEQLCVLGLLMGEQPCTDLLFPEVGTRA